MSGLVSHRAGLAAEESVAQLYCRSGCAITERRWRGQAGEIDMIARDGDTVIFIEVKQSRSHAEAALHLTARQMQRIFQAAEEFIGSEPLGSLTDIRFDVALVDGVGRITILENAYTA